MFRYAAKRRLSPKDARKSAAARAEAARRAVSAAAGAPRTRQPLPPPPHNAAHEFEIFANALSPAALIIMPARS